LTFPEIRRVVEGHRVHEKIRQMARNDEMNENPTMGVARQSDFDKLQEFDEHRRN